ncbi:MAG: hypothetical protein FJX56_03645 [Alphaproteobacteria bacterium]|nr:hypothetical protein [Alphaproteobacteria bacterium]
MLNRRFQSLLGGARSFVDGTRSSSFSLIFELKISVMQSIIELPADALSPSRERPAITAVRTDPIAGLAGNETFTIAVTRSSVTTNVTIGLSQVSGGLNIDNIVSHINGTLATAGVGTTFSVKRYNETAVGIAVNGVSSEALSFAAGATDVSSAAYVVGNTAGGGGGSAFLSKLQELTAAAPTRAFFERIDAPRANDRAHGVAVDSAGNVYVVGSTQGNLSEEENTADVRDVFLRKFDATGNVIFTRLLGAAEDAAGFGLAIDSEDNVIVAGQVRGHLSPGSVGGLNDTFVTKFDSTGSELFTRQLAPAADAAALAVAVDAAGNIFVAGRTGAAIATGQTHGGGMDGFLTKLDADGDKLYDQQFGGAGDESAAAIHVTAGGTVFVAGAADGNGFLRKFADTRSSATLSYVHDLGALGSAGHALVNEELGIKRLGIKALNGSTVDLLCGREGFDALRGLSLRPSRLFGPVNGAAAESAAASTFDLGLSHDDEPRHPQWSRRGGYTDYQRTASDPRHLPVHHRRARAAGEGPRQGTLNQIAAYEAAARRLELAGSTASQFASFFGG